jgi:hypothetical protein
LLLKKTHNTSIIKYYEKNEQPKLSDREDDVEARIERQSCEARRVARRIDLRNTQTRVRFELDSRSTIIDLTTIWFRAPRHNARMCAPVHREFVYTRSHESIQFERRRVVSAIEP